MQLGKRYNARYIATNDTHYINPEDARLQDILLCIQTGKLITDPNRFKMSVESFYLRSPEEMGRLFAEVPESLSNTLLVAETLQRGSLQQGLPPAALPRPRRPHRRDLPARALRGRPAAPLRRARRRRRRCASAWNTSWASSTRWASTPTSSSFGTCAARPAGAASGTTRAARRAGSMVAYTLDITLIEPLVHGLIFERFLNPGRISMPDIDLDFQDDRRPELMQYTAEKYGQDKRRPDHHLWHPGRARRHPRRRAGDGYSPGRGRPGQQADPQRARQGGQHPGCPRAGARPEENLRRERLTSKS